MRFAIYQGQSLHAIIDSEPGKAPASVHAEALRTLNGASSVIPVLSPVHEAQLVADGTAAETLGRGFTHEGRVFSLSTAAQLSLNAALLQAGAMTYPILWPTRDNEAVVEVTDAAALAALHLSMTLAIFAQRQEAAREKRAVL